MPADVSSGSRCGWRSVSSAIGSWARLGRRVRSTGSPSGRCPFLEELLFRGLLFNLLLRGGVSVGRASAVTAFGFVLIHLPGWSFMAGLSAGSVTLGISIGLLGLYLGLLVGRSRSVWPAYVVHAGNNAFSTGLLQALL